jgi:hypothetical protein
MFSDVLNERRRLSVDQKHLAAGADETRAFEAKVVGAKGAHHRPT